MKRKLLFILLMQTLAVTAVMADELRVGKVGGIPGGEAQLTIELGKYYSDTYCAYQFDLMLPDGMTLSGDGQGGYAYTLPDGRYSDPQQVVGIARQQDGTYRVVCYSNENKPLLGESGELITLTVHITSELAEQTYEARLQQIQMAYVGSDGHAQRGYFSDVYFQIGVEQPITITVLDASCEYGDYIPQLEYTTSGAPLRGYVSLQCDAGYYSPAGTYPITVGMWGIENHNVIVINGTLTIRKATLTVRADDAEREQGEENPEFTLTYNGFKYWEDASVLTVKPVATTTATADSPAGIYPITVQGGEADNYTFSYVSGTLTVKSSTGIDPVAPANIGEGGGRIYDLRGRYVGTTLSDLPRGIYIVGGKKVVKD